MNTSTNSQVQQTTSVPMPQDTNAQISSQQYTEPEKTYNQKTTISSNVNQPGNTSPQITIPIENKGTRAEVCPKSEGNCRNTPMDFFYGRSYTFWAFLYTLLTALFGAILGIYIQRRAHDLDSRERSWSEKKYDDYSTEHVY